VSALCSETGRGDGFREPGFSEERRLEPQITIGLLAGQAGFPLMVSAFEGSKAETRTMLPVIEAFMAARQLPGVTVVAGAGMISGASMKELGAAGLSFILGMKVPDVPYVVEQWRREHPGQEIPDGHVFTQPWPAGPRDKRRDQVIYSTCKAGRARRTLHGIDQQAARAARAVAGLAPVRRNRFIQLDGAARSVNRDLEARARTLAGIKGYKANLAAAPDGERVTPDFVISSYHRLFEIEKSFRMSKSDLQARSACHRKRDSIGGPPDDRLRRARRQQADRGTDRLVDQEARQDRPPLPRDPDQRRAARHHRRRPASRRHPPGPRRHQPRQPACALN
jgi:hypothetical protein